MIPSWIGRLRANTIMFFSDPDSLSCVRSVGFLAVPILAGFDPVAYDRGQEQPVPPTPRLALDDADWKASHGSEGSAVVRGPLKEALA